MSKSLGNVINPDKLIKKYGADVTRAYLMFMGPYEGDVVWNTRTIQGVDRFVKRWFAFIQQAWEKTGNSEKETEIAVNRLINKVQNGILDWKFNTAVAAFMEFYNKYNDKIFTKDQIERLITISTPIMPHLAEELWCITGHKGFVTENEWPEVDKEMLVEDVIEIPIQINGKVRDRVEIKKGMTEDQVKEIVLSKERIKELLKDRSIKRFVYIDDKIVNIVL
jgi:leucyl-tRNA synthetase